jgi:hypothetical protein
MPTFNTKYPTIDTNPPLYADNIAQDLSSNAGNLVTSVFAVVNAIAGLGTGTVTSVALSMPSAFNVSSSPITTSGTLGVTAIGSTNQYIRGDGTLATFPTIPSGTVTSVGISGSDFTIGGSPITTSGTITLSVTNSAVIGKVLTGLSIVGSTISPTDTIISAFGAVQNQINALLGGSIYQGTWNALTNSPALTSSVGTKGYYYVVNVAGTTNLDGTTDWAVGDWAIFNGTIWQKVDNTDAVSSVNGAIGAVVITTTGTANRISVTGGSGLVPTIDISATYVGQTSITTLGTIGTGTWQGTKVSEVYGGTNQSSYTTGDTIYASATNTLSKLAIGTTGQVLTIAGGVPTWATPTTSPLTTKGDLFTYSTVNARLGVGADATILMADSTQTTGNKWIAVSGDITIATTGVTTIKNGVALGGDPTTTTQASGDSSTKIATTAFVKAWANTQNLIYYSNGQLTSTNTTAEELLASKEIVAGVLNANSRVEWRLLGNANNSATAKTIRVRIHTSNALGGTIYSSFNLANIPGSGYWGQLNNDNSLSSQVGYNGGSITGAGQGTQSSLVGTSAINTASSSLWVIFSTQKATGTDTLKIINWEVRVINP